MESCNMKIEDVILWNKIAEQNNNNKKYKKKLQVYDSALKQGK